MKSVGEKLLTIRRSTGEDMDRIQSWLEDEYKQNDRGGFYNNIDRIRNKHESSQVIVAVVLSEEFPVAFCAGSRNAIDYFEVHSDYRNRGIGKFLARYWISRSKKGGVAGIELDCKPASSEKFWRGLGFNIVKQGENWNSFTYIPAKAVLLMGRKRSVDMSLPGTSITIDIQNGSVGSTFFVEIDGRLSPDGVIQLARRVPFYSPNGEGDKTITVKRDGHIVWSDERNCANSIGLNESQAPFYYFDTIELGISTLADSLL